MEGERERNLSYIHKVTNSNAHHLKWTRRDSSFWQTKLIHTHGIYFIYSWSSDARTHTHSSELRTLLPRFSSLVSFENCQHSIDIGNHKLIQLVNIQTPSTIYYTKCINYSALWWCRVYSHTFSDRIYLLRTPLLKNEKQTYTILASQSRYLVGIWY